MKFIMTIDTEGDNQWDHGNALTVENIKYVPRFQDLCEKYSIKPTYLVTSEVCNDKYAREIFTDYSQAGKAEIGAHLHSWTTPPFLDKEGYRFNDHNHAFANELPKDLLIEKLKNLTGQIESSFGKPPSSFRSGRYGFDEDLARMLHENGYLVDSSVTPYTSWSDYKGIPGGKGGPDFRMNKPWPYTYNYANGSLIEIPITILPLRNLLIKTKAIAKYFLRSDDKKYFLRVSKMLVYNNQPLWMRPLIWMNIGLFDELLSETIKIKLPFIVMMFHSSELMPGCSIYRPDKDSIEKLYDLLEQFFIILQNKNIESITLSEAAKSYKL
jgi:hypothetical protein